MFVCICERLQERDFREEHVWWLDFLWIQFVVHLQYQVAMVQVEELSILYIFKCHDPRMQIIVAVLYCIFK